MKLIIPFAALALCSGAVLTLLPQGTLRRAASLALGLTLMLLWVQGLRTLLKLPSLPEMPDTPLVTSSEAFCGNVSAVIEQRERLAAEAVSRACGLEASVDMDEHGSICGVTLFGHATAEQVSEACAAAGVSAEQVTADLKP